ncbi:hypothetical protein G7054_g4780 [Neopestalotiopsis clavispora]|nr:hypothetical protein G7054_g4780 [Neopestalotiopsis clavispora]
MSKQPSNHDPLGQSEDSDSIDSSEEEDLYDMSEKLDAAFRGHRLPSNDLLRYPHVRQCVIAGIRRHLQFAKSKSTKRWCDDNAENFPEFTRARNARLIMSGTVPRMDWDEFYPYCIWYPDVASEETYARLARKYPEMRYQVGRACAVAGYTALYESLQLLPDVSIAEEARDNAATGQPIFDRIMASPVKYAVMDDYERLINERSPRLAYLNNDTAVRSSLGVYKTDEATLLKPYGYTHWDITEDGGMQDGIDATETVDDPIGPDHAHLLYSPLPQDLPAVNKDLLILMAAWEGNIDRYARLKRPHMIRGEAFCILRGVHHSTVFARWISDTELTGRLTGDNATETRLESLEARYNISRAVNARYIMSNDVARIRTASKNSLPYMIWYPQRPNWQTLEEIARLRPEMKRAVAHACIVCDYRSLWANLCPEPHPVLYREAKRGTSQIFYREDLETRSAELGIDLERQLTCDERIEARAVGSEEKETSSIFLHGLASADLMDEGNGHCRGDERGFYGDGELLPFGSGRVNLFICATDKARAQAAKEEGGWLYPLDVTEDND